MAVIYLCDKKACDKCSYPECKHTFNIDHAKNFDSYRHNDANQDYWEQESSLYPKVPDMSAEQDQTYTNYINELKASYDRVKNMNEIHMKQNLGRWATPDEPTDTSNKELVMRNFERALGESKSNSGKINNIQYLLVCLAEECAEVQKEVTKGLRFGLYDVWEGNPTPIENLIHEYYDLVGVWEMLKEVVAFPKVNPEQLIQRKKDKILEYMEYARKAGALEELT